MTNFSPSSADRSSHGRSFRIRSLALVLGAIILSGCGNEQKTKTVDELVDEAAAKLAIADLVSAKAAISNAYVLASGDVDVRLLKAQIDFHARDYASAAKLFKGVAEDKSLDRKLRAQGWAGLGVLDQCANERDLARIDFLKALRLDGKNLAAWYHLGYIYHNDYGYYKAAKDCYEYFVSLSPAIDDRVLKVQRSTIPALREAQDNSILEIPGARNPDSAACAKALAAAEAAMKKKTFKTARMRYEESVKADPTSEPAAIGFAKFLVKNDQTAAGKKLALEQYRRACKLAPSKVSDFLAAGEFAAATGNHLTARELYSRAVAADPTNISAIDGLIRALRKTNQSKTASAYQLYREFLAVKVK